MKNSTIAEPKIIQCPYWIVKSKEDRKAVEQLNGIAWPDDTGLVFPYIMGKEGGFRFQCAMSEMRDYHDPDDNETYTYILKKL